MWLIDSRRLPAHPMDGTSPTSARAPSCFVASGRRCSSRRSDGRSGANSCSPFSAEGRTLSPTPLPQGEGLRFADQIAAKAPCPREDIALSRTCTHVCRDVLDGRGAARRVCWQSARIDQPRRNTFNECCRETHQRGAQWSVALEATLRSVSSCGAMWPSMRRADAPPWWRAHNNNDASFYVLHLGRYPTQKETRRCRLLFDLPWRGGGVPLRPARRAL